MKITMKLVFTLWATIVAGIFGFYMIAEFLIEPILEKIRDREE